MVGLRTCVEEPLYKHKANYFPCNDYMRAVPRRIWLFWLDIGRKPI